MVTSSTVRRAWRGYLFARSEMGMGVYRSARFVLWYLRAGPRLVELAGR